MRTIKPRFDDDEPNPVAECMEAKNVISMLEELIDELRGMGTFLDLLSDVTASKRYSHRKMAKFLKRVKGHCRDDMVAAYKYRSIYRNLVADYEHILGPIEAKRKVNYADLSASLESIMDGNDRARLKKDLLDG